VLTFDELLGKQKIIAILRGQAPDRALELAKAVWDAGAGLVEVPVQDETGFAALTADQVGRAQAAGAAFTIAPGFSAEVAAASHAAGLPHLPGIATATELQQALSARCAWVKAFPASALGPAWFREMRGPFPGVNFVATGGITAETAADFLAAGARALGVGSAVLKPGGLAAMLAVLDNAVHA
jgi:2-dehydro-3-deoxyphosphogluconate aldolase / (4S)-4-hydroxy-2-oxoglutarate aldolase